MKCILLVYISIVFIKNVREDMWKKDMILVIIMFYNNNDNNCKLFYFMEIKVNNVICDLLIDSKERS